MGLTGLVFGVVAVVWLIYLIPLFLNRRDNGLMDEIEPGEPFSHTVTIVRRGEPLDSAEESVAVVSTPLNRRAALRELRALDAAAARRRRRVLGFLALATLTVVAAAAMALVAWWWVAAPVLLIVLFLVVARFSVRTMRRDLDARARTIRGEDADEATISFAGLDEGDLVAEDVHEVSVELTGPVESTGSLWDPIPITAPTYVSQPLAPRTVRTIDLSAPVASGSVVPVTADRPDDFGRADAGRTDAGAAPERRRASGE
ncbi:hypothetical protein [Propioniciclava sp.]|uniref:divisome protein SepX/GlpR n=1 Tax=Propioniciclava sp. TaxID=2038686 RepID=UPI0026111668|nr:hypothetical protein [Propioniciclava sp.]